MESITLQMFSEKTEPPFLSITCSKPIAQYKKLCKRFPAYFNMIVSGVPLFASDFLAGVKYCPLISFSHYQSSCPAAPKWSDHEPALHSSNGIPWVLLSGALCQRFLQGICFPGGIWAVLSCCHNEGFQQNWGVSHTVGPAGTSAVTVTVLVQFHDNSNNDSDRHNKNKF